MTAQLAPTPIQKFFDNNGNPLFNGKLYSYVAGTSTPQATYTDSTMGTQNTNPVILNARGEANVWLDTTLSYKLVLQEANGTQIWAVDNIPGNGVFGTVQNIAALRNVTGVGVSNYQAIIVDGYTTAGDGGGGTFWWNSISTVADNGGTIIAPTGVSTGRWYRLYSGEINVQWFGAKCDGLTNDSSAVQSSIDNNKGGTICIPENTVCLAAGILLSGSAYNNTRLICYGTFRLLPNGGNTNFQNSWSGIIFQLCDGCYFDGYVDGNRSNMTALQHIYCVCLAGVSNFTSQYINAKEIRGDALYIDQSTFASASTNSSDITVGTLIAHNTANDGRNALSIISCNRFTCNEIYSYQIGGTISGLLMPGGIDIETNSGTIGESITDVVIGNANVVTIGMTGVQILGYANTNDATRDWNVSRIRIDNFNLINTNSSQISTQGSINISRVSDVYLNGIVTGPCNGTSMDYVDRIKCNIQMYNVIICAIFGFVGDIQHFDICINANNYTYATYAMFIRGASYGRFSGSIFGSTSTSYAILLDNNGSAYTQTDVIYSIDAPHDGTLSHAFANGNSSAVLMTNCSIQDCDFSGYGTAILDPPVNVKMINIKGVNSGNGAPSFTAPAGTIYVRYDGAAGTRIYINQNGSTTWAAISGV